MSPPEKFKCLPLYPCEVGHPRSHLVSVYMYFTFSSCNLLISGETDAMTAVCQSLTVGKSLFVFVNIHLNMTV